jgi:hypothetical protein
MSRNLFETSFLSTFATQDEKKKVAVVVRVMQRAGTVGTSKISLKHQQQNLFLDQMEKKAKK